MSYKLWRVIWKFFHDSETKQYRARYFPLKNLKKIVKLRAPLKNISMTITGTGLLITRVGFKYKGHLA